ncbi:MAG: VWA domain-containing protein [Gammaproteobacteria bacterium]|nr:VWA domain-containing protein [Gammaproteobacteria bacterium]NIR28307.1 VWA domain-containing protein [Gammaproteobacteria bacterium]NIR96721.1 VWA domain-containing protein [Gammaproteobacteria bacterium]NIT62423.1 VWA domain-containing protein [Gammaproteobacteria bacterium]NIV19356.1 VWA domain-containing protein [Gammaproteobacteria bacterium]
MSIDLKDYHAQLDAFDPHVRDTLEASFAEAARVMSPRGLANYMEGGKALCDLGRGTDLVISYLQEMPQVAKEVGEDIVTDVVTESMKLSSMVSGEVISLLLSNLPTAAQRLGDPDLLRQFLHLVHQLSAKAPRALRPMLSHLDELFSRLTLGGLRRWALWGAQAHARDYEAQAAYFALESADSQAVLRRERRGTLFIDTQRRLNFYLRALWGRDFFMRPTSGDYDSREGYRSFIESRVIHVPDAYDDFEGICGMDQFRAAAAHAAAHLVYTRAPLSAQELTPAHMLLIGLFEDARVEQLAISEFPGLKRLWLPLHEKARQARPASHPVTDLLRRIGLALLDEQYRDDDLRVSEAARKFRALLGERAQDNSISWELGVELYNRLGRHAALPNLSTLETALAPYRDDNRYIWAFDEAEWQAAEYVPASHRQVRKSASLMEMVNEVDCELAGDDAQEVWTLETEFFRDGDPIGVSVNEIEGSPPVTQPYHYQEWDYQVQLHRPDWVTVLEKRQALGDPELIDRTLAEYRPVASRLRHIIDSLQPEGIVRQRRQEDGDEIDINAAIRAMVDLRMGQTPDPRINIRYLRKTRDLAVVVLLDLSESTNEMLPGTDRPVVQLAREATALLAWAIDGIGDPFAVHGFASDGRHDVQYFRFKDFEQPYDDTARARIAGMQGGLSTRMGGALRHAAEFLKRRPQQKKLILLVSDGEPADIDVRDPQYLRHDTKKAVEELATAGVVTHCLTLDPEADTYVSRIFGANRYTVVDHVQRLPERLPQLFASLTS